MTESHRTILVLNAGSSSLKMALFDAADPTSQLASGNVSRIGGDDASVHLQWGDRKHDVDSVSCANHDAALRLLLRGLDELQHGWQADVGAAGHRVVHGGEEFTEPTIVTAEVEHELDALKELAPLHNARAVDVIRAALEAVPGVPQVACFDTMFHASLPDQSRLYALPRDLADRYGIRRYGFHGLSCEGAMETLDRLNVEPRGRVIICHLGAGASVTAVLDGRSMDTSMGFTPLEGLIMATRSGSIDPSIPLYLQRHAGMTPDDVERTLERKSGLLGLSGISGDVGILEERAAAGDEHAREALEAFAYVVRRTVGGYIAILEGIDVLVLTGGIGEHGATMRRRIVQPLGHLGLDLDEQINANASGREPTRISKEGTGTQVWIIPAREEAVIARQAAHLLDL